MTYDPSKLQQRSEDQLLQDFAGPQTEQLKFLNLIYSVYRAIQGGGGGGSVSWDDITNKPTDLATDADITDARANAVLRTVSVSSTVNNANHLGQLVVSTSATGITVTLADDLPTGASGTILQTGAGAVTVALESGNPVTATGKDPITAGAASAVQWVKLASSVQLFGGLADAA